MPDGRDVASPIRRPREFSRAFGAMVAEQAGPRGRIVVLRNAVEGRTFSTAHKSQTVYHGSVAYLEFALLLVFLEETARRAQREYRFAVWAEGRAGGRHAGSRCLDGAGRCDGEAAAGAGRQRLRARAGGVLVAGAGRDAAGLRRRRRRGRAPWRCRPAIRARRWPAHAAGVIPAPTTRRAPYPEARQGAACSCRPVSGSAGSVKWRMIGPSGTVADQPRTARSSVGGIVGVPAAA